MRRIETGLSYLHTQMISIYELLAGRNSNFRCLFTRGPGFWSDPSQETNTGFFNTLAEPGSQRENWYDETLYISEFWCAISNLAFFYVGFYYRSWQILFAGVASLAYHSFAHQWLLHLDRIGVLLVLIKMGIEYSIFLEHPWLFSLPVAVVLLNLTDVYLGRYCGYTWSHVVWHFSAAGMAALFLSYMEPRWSLF